MKRRPESVMYYSSKNGLPDIYDDDDTIFNGVNDRINQNDIQDEELELSAALFTASKENLTSDDLQETDILLGCKVQLIALKKNHLHNNYHGISFYFIFTILFLSLYLQHIYIY